MKSALLLSISFHVAAGLVWSLVVKITQVRFVPRQVYTVSIVAPAELPQPKPEPVVTHPEPEPEPEVKDEEPAPPAEKPKPKPVEPKPKEVKKTMPTTDPKRAEPPPDTPAQEPEPVTTGEISLDDQDFPFAYYITNMRRKIAAFWRVPGESSQDKYCVVYFRVLRGGSIVAPSVETSSGNLLFDQAALRAVHQASPLPALPPGYVDDELGVHFSFSYQRE